MLPAPVFGILAKSTSAQTGRREGCATEANIDAKLLRELREQVNTLLSANQLLTGLVRESGSARDRDCLAMANQSLYRLIRTIQHLETVQTAEELFSPHTVDVSDLCRRVGEELKLLAPLLGVTFTWRLEQENLLTQADPDLLERALLNLLTNALQAAGQGGSVSLRLAKKGEALLFTVEDDGAGLSLPNEPQDPFLKTSAGLGLGLDVARQTARLHGGQLMWHLREGGGTAMVFSIPLQKPEESGLVRASSMPYDRTGGFSTLLVELSPLLPAEQFFPDHLE